MVIFFKDIVGDRIIVRITRVGYAVFYSLLANIKPGVKVEEKCILVLQKCFAELTESTLIIGTRKFDQDNFFSMGRRGIFFNYLLQLLKRGIKCGQINNIKATTISGPKLFAGAIVFEHTVQNLIIIIMRSGDPMFDFCVCLNKARNT